MDFDEFSYTLIEKAKIKSLKNNNRRLICMYNATLYVSDRYCNWRNMRLNGFITLEIDYEIKSRFICLYDMDTLELQFQYELYLNFENYLFMCESSFLSFEVDGGFIGIQFIYDNEAISFKVFVSKYTQNFVLKLTEKKSFDFSEEYKSSALVLTRKKILWDIYTNYLKSELKEMSKSSENQAKKLMGTNKDENGTSELAEYLQLKSNLENLFVVFGEILFKKIKNLNFLLKITFDPKLKKFNIDNIPAEMKKALNKNGIKKHQFNDTEFALNIFKNFIEKYDKNLNCLNFFGRLVKDKKHRKALDWVGIIRKKKANENHEQSRIYEVTEENKNKSNSSMQEKSDEDSDSKSSDDEEQKDLNEKCDIQTKINMGRKRMSILRDTGTTSIPTQIGNARKSIIKINEFVTNQDFEIVNRERGFSNRGQNKESYKLLPKDNIGIGVSPNKNKNIDSDQKNNEITNPNMKGNGKNVNELMQLSIKQRREFLTKYDVEDNDSCDSDWSS